MDTEYSWLVCHKDDSDPLKVSNFKQYNTRANVIISIIKCYGDVISSFRNMWRESRVWYCSISDHIISLKHDLPFAPNHFLNLKSALPFLWGKWSHFRNV